MIVNEFNRKYLSMFYYFSALHVLYYLQHGWVLSYILYIYKHNLDKLCKDDLFKLKTFNDIRRNLVRTAFIYLHII